MMTRLAAFGDRFDALSRRERVTVAVGTIAGIVLLGYFIGIDPALVTARGEAKRAEAARTDLAKLNADLTALSQQANPDLANRQALAQVRGQLAAGETKLQATQAGMVPPDKMRAFLESLLAKHPQVELVGLKTLPPAPVLSDSGAESGSAAVAAQGSNIYKHGVEIKIAGHYNDLVAYLAELEHLPQRLLWNKVALSVDVYPRSILTVTVYTLSLDEQWLTV